MAHYYGEYVDKSYDPGKDEIYKAFVEYFENPTMTKIKDVKTYSMYVAKVYCLLGTQHRYIIVFVPKDNQPLKTQESLEYLRWVSLQTRTLTDNHNIPPQMYKARRTKAFMQSIDMVGKQNNNYVYNAEIFPLQITLLSSKKSESMEYQPKGVIMTALETYNTIIEWK